MKGKIIVVALLVALAVPAIATTGEYLPTQTFNAFVQNYVMPHFNELYERTAEIPQHYETLEIHDVVTQGILIDSPEGSTMLAPCSFGQTGPPYCLFVRGNNKIVNTGQVEIDYEWGA